MDTDKDRFAFECGTRLTASPTPLRVRGWRAGSPPPQSDARSTVLRRAWSRRWSISCPAVSPTLGDAGAWRRVCSYHRRNLTDRFLLVRVPSALRCESVPSWPFTWPAPASMLPCTRSGESRTCWPPSVSERTSAQPCSCACGGGHAASRSPRLAPLHLQSAGAGIGAALRRPPARAGRRGRGRLRAVLAPTWLRRCVRRRRPRASALASPACCLPVVVSATSAAGARHQRVPAPRRRPRRREAGFLRPAPPFAAAIDEAGAQARMGRESR